MAEAAKDAAKDAKDGAAPKPKGKGKLIAIVAGVVLLAAGGGVGAWLMLGKKPAEGAEAKAQPKKVPVFVELDTFTVNLKKGEADEAERYMQLKLVAEVRDVPTGELVKTMMPAVRSEIILLLGSKRAEDISTREGKEKLAGEIVLAANKPLDRTPADKGVEGVNFTHIIVQ